MRILGFCVRHKVIAVPPDPAPFIMQILIFTLPSGSAGAARHGFELAHIHFLSGRPGMLQFRQGNVIPHFGGSLPDDISVAGCPFEIDFLQGRFVPLP